MDRSTLLPKCTTGGIPEGPASGSAGCFHLHLGAVSSNTGVYVSTMPHKKYSCQPPTSSSASSKTDSLVGVKLRDRTPYDTH